MTTQLSPSVPCDLVKLNIHDPVLLAVDWPSWYCIHRLDGQCRYYAETPTVKNLSFCFQREVWIVYARHASLRRALHLGYAVQANNAQKILLILLADSLIQGNKYAGYVRTTH